MKSLISAPLCNIYIEISFKKCTPPPNKSMLFFSNFKRNCLYEKILSIVCPK